jgi:phosphoglycolate phosphatase
MENIRLIIFDLDGTLVDAYEAILRSFHHTMRSLQLKSRPDRTIRKAVGWGDENLLKPFVSPRQLKKALSIYRRHHKYALVKYARLFPFASKVLGTLKKKGYRLAVASNRPTRFSRILIRHLKVNKYFDYVLCADTLRQGKPHPEILIEIMKRWSIRPDEALYVGDMAIDADCARRAGVKAVIVTTGSSSLGEIRKKKPYRIIKKIGDLLKALL